MHVRHIRRIRESRVSGQVFVVIQSHEENQSAVTTPFRPSVSVAALAHSVVCRSLAPTSGLLQPQLATDPVICGWWSASAQAKVVTYRQVTPHGWPSRLPGVGRSCALMLEDRPWRLRTRQRLRCQHCACRVERRTNRSNTSGQQRGAWRENSGTSSSKDSPAVTASVANQSTGGANTSNPAPVLVFFFFDESGAWYSSEMQSENRSNQAVFHFGLCKRRAMSSKFVHISKHITNI